MIVKCARLKQLNVVNSDFRLQKDSVYALSILRQLEILQMNALPTFDPAGVASGSFSSLKAFNIEDIPHRHAMKFIMRFMNACKAIGSVHIDFFGDPVGLRYDSPPPLASERWSTLHTVVCTCYLTRNRKTQHLRA